MRTLLLNDERIEILEEMENNKELKLWKKVEGINWKYLTEQYKDEGMNYINELVGAHLVRNYCLDDIVELNNFVVDKRKRLMDKFQSFYRILPKNEKERYKLGDDSTWDLCSCIVGFGQSMYEYVLENIESLIDMQEYDFENFEYGFTHATYNLTLGDELTKNINDEEYYDEKLPNDEERQEDVTEDNDDEKGTSLEYNLNENGGVKSFVSEFDEDDTHYKVEYNDKTNTIKMTEESPNHSNTIEYSSNSFNESNKIDEILFNILDFIKVKIK